MKRLVLFLRRIFILMLLFSIVLPSNTSMAETDSSPPILADFTMSAKQGTLGYTIYFSADVTDDLSGVRYVGFIYDAPTGNGAKFIYLSYNPNTQRYEGKLTIGKYDVNGVWRMSSFFTGDNQGNSYAMINTNVTGTSGQNSPNYVWKDLSEYDITVSGTIDDATPPKLYSLTVSPTTASAGDDIKFIADISDDVSGVKDAFIYYRLPDDPNGDRPKNVRLIYNNETNKYEGHLTITDTHTIGLWKVIGIGLEDNCFNGYNYLNSDIYGNDGVIDYRYPLEYRSLGQYNLNIQSPDQTPPVTTIALASGLPLTDQWYNSNVVIHLNASDDSGIKNTEVRINGQQWQQYSEEIVLDQEGVNQVEYRSVDNVGNMEETKYVDVKIDKTAPTLNVSFDSSIITDRNHMLVPIKASVFAKDGLSGIDSFELLSLVSNQFDNEEGDGNTIQDIEGAKFGTPDVDFFVRAERNGSGDRIYTVTYRATDNAGNNVITSQEIVVKHDSSEN